MINETKVFFETIGLEMNKEKSATNCLSCSEDAQLLEGHQGYKYLGTIKNLASIVMEETINKIKAEMIKRTEALCATKLNAKNLFKAINEHAISVINYHVGVLKLEPDDFVKIDKEIRKVLISNKIHLQPSCKERLYLPRELLGRGLQSIEHKSECMLHQLNETLEASKLVSLRRAAILKVEKDCKSHLYLINGFLKAKYPLTDEKVTLKALHKMQINLLYSDINSKALHR